MLQQSELLAVFNTPIPWIVGLCIDCTISISDRNFKTMKSEIINFLANIHYRAGRLQGLPSDFVSVTAFKDSDDIYGPSRPIDIVKMDMAGNVNELCGWVDRLKNTGRATALYDAIQISAQELVSIDNRLPHRYLKVVIAVTDGIDNDSSISCGNLPFPNNQGIHLAVIGVGSEGKSELARIKNKATSTHSISEFSDLFEAISIALTRIIHSKTTISW